MTRQSLWGRITEYFATGLNVVTRQVRIVTSRWSRAWHAARHDWGRADYGYWRKAYYARAKGLEVSGLFIKPLVSKIAGWVMGRPPQWRMESERSAEALNGWWAEHHAQILRGYRAALKQGDAFLVVNSDLTLTAVLPDTAEPIVSDDDYTEIAGWTITQTIPHPTRTNDHMTVVDEYTAERRVHRVEINGMTVEETTYPNLIGRVPVIHIPNQPQDGETFGHPEAEALLEVMQRYGAVFDAAIEGNILQGRPTPVLAFEDTASLDKFWADYGEKQTQTLPDGTTESVTTLAVDLNQILTVAGATFEYKSPGSFSQDVERLLGLMFYLILEHTELPEFVFGNAIASSKASAEAQMPVFEKFIEMRRGEAGDWLTELAQVVLGYLALMEPGVVATETPALQWEALTENDKALTLATVQWAYAEGLLDARTALMLAPVDVEDIDGVLRAADEERQASLAGLVGGPREQTMVDAFERELARLGVGG